VRILLTSQPIYSHLVPALVPLARVARRHGHQVAVATAGSMAGELARHDVPLLALPRVPGQDELRTEPGWAHRFGLPERAVEPGRRTMTGSVWRRITRAYAGPVAGWFAADLLPVARQWRPDVIVREPAEFAGYLVAERLGVPHVTLDISPFAASDLPMVVDVLTVQRSAMGLPAVADPWHPHRHLRAGLVPESWYPEALRLPTGRYYRAPGPDDADPDGSDPDPRRWYGDQPADRPLVLVSLGTLILGMPGIADVLPIVVAALARLPVTAVVSLGGRPELAGTLGPVPDNVRLAPLVPQRRLLATCDLFVTHAGFNSVSEAVAAGTPMVALPAMADQPANADRIAELGLGVRLDLDRLTVPEVEASCRRVLTEPAFRRRARAMRRELLGAPGFDRLIDDLAGLTARPR
jgi:hypothetical protein